MKGEWKINYGLYCCYNAFSKIDIFVEILIPGGVFSYYLDETNQK